MQKDSPILYLLMRKHTYTHTYKWIHTQICTGTFVPVSVLNLTNAYCTLLRGLLYIITAVDVNQEPV